MNVERINAVSKDLIQAVANSTTLQSVLLEGNISIDNVKELGKSKVLQEFLDASSRIITGGSATAARAMAISCRWPWDRFAPFPVSSVS